MHGACTGLTTTRALGRHLHSGNQRLQLDVEQWKSHSAELAAATAAERQQWALKQEEVDVQMKEIRQLLDLQVGGSGVVCCTCSMHMHDCVLECICQHYNSVVQRGCALVF